MQKLVLGIFILLVMSSVAVAIQTGYTSETRYTTSPSISVKRDIVFSSNRYGMTYIKPYGGFGAKAASRGSFGMKDAEAGAANLPYGDWIPQGRDPGHISNYYSSARGYTIMNKYVDLAPLDLSLVSRPQINGTPAGYARVISIKDQGVGIPVGTVYLRTKDLPPIAPDFIYEAWLIDEETGYSMSIGLFQPAGIGRVTSLDYQISGPLTSFDSIIVTVEPFPDTNPGPGMAILQGPLKEGVKVQ
jgi:hypothetical protein